MSKNKKTYRIPEETIERIRNTADIYDVLAQYVDLKKRGRNYFGLCPFHYEKTPSFSVTPDQQIYHCFGCGAGGNVFSFIMEHEKVTFVEAVQQLGKKYGIHMQYENAVDGLYAIADAIGEVAKAINRRNELEEPKEDIFK
tara:strand:+ start:67 stop:489 length:423 start_codon:yes stop_codon:yes gene_type:complete